MVLITLTLAILAVLCSLEASPVIVNDDYERKYEIQEDSSAASEHSSPYQHSSILNVRSAQSPPQFNTYPYQPFGQFSPYSPYNQQLQLPNQPSQIAAAQHGNQHQYLAALQQYYAASKRTPASSFSSPTAAYSQLPISQPAAQLPQTGYQHPLGALYSAAPDVSQFQFSGNGVNYAF